jgi:coproporphyrinogen III oxidase-like Fe-S oxidoreductase
VIARVVSTILKRSFRPFVFESGQPRPPHDDVPRLGLYLHIPFCRSLCRFCPYFKEEYRPAVAADYVEALKAEIKGAAGENKATVTSVYYGGGTPALLLDYLPGIQRLIAQTFSVQGLAGLELHPDDVTPHTLDALRSAGIDMVSLGMQSFQSHCLSSLGRKAAGLSDRVLLARDTGFRVVDVDLIFGIPGQSAADIAADFRIAADRGATQISTYPFIEFTFTGNPHKPLGRRKKRLMLEAVLETSAQLGWERTSVWTFAVRGGSRYSSVTRDNYLGFGPSAASLLRHSFSLNVFSVAEYVRRIRDGDDPTAFVVRLTERERMLFWLFWHSYNLGIERDLFADIFGSDPEADLSVEFRAARWLGILVADSRGYRLTKRGAYLFHLVEQSYTDQYIDRIWRLGASAIAPDKIVIH